MRRHSPSLKDLKISRISWGFRISAALTKVDKVSYVSFSLKVTKRAKISAIVGAVKYNDSSSPRGIFSRLIPASLYQKHFS